MTNNKPTANVKHGTLIDGTGNYINWHNICFTSYTYKCNSISVLGWIFIFKASPSDNVITTLLEGKNNPPPPPAFLISFSKNSLRGPFLSASNDASCSFTRLHLKSSMLALNSVFFCCCFLFFFLQEEHKIIIIGVQSLVTKSKRKSNIRKEQMFTVFSM